MGKILLTGFEPFGSYEYNPVQESTQFFDGKKIGDNDVVGVVLRCTYLSAFDKLRTVIEKMKPTGIIETGLSSSIKGIRFERIAKNKMESAKYADADGWEPKGLPVREGGPEFLHPSGDYDQLADVLRRNDIPVEMSDDAGNFICNSLHYLTADYIQRHHLNIPHVFIHAPWTDNFKDSVQLDAGKIMIAQQTLLKAIELLIQNIAN